MLRPPGVRRWGPRGFGPRGSGAPVPPPTLFQQVRALTIGRPLWTAGHFAPFGTMQVASLIDWNDATHLAAYDGAPGNQCPTPTSSPAVFAGAPTIHFVSTSGQRYLSNRPASAWGFSCDGVDNEKWDVFVCNDTTGTGVVSASRNTGPGTQTYYTGGAVYHYLQGSTGGVVGPELFGLVPAVGMQLYTAVRHKISDAQQYQLRCNGALNAAGLFVNAPAPTPEYPMCLGSVPFGGYPMSVDWAATFFTIALDTTQRATVESWIAAGLPTT